MPLQKKAGNVLNTPRIYIYIYIYLYIYHALMVASEENGLVMPSY